MGWRILVNLIRQSMLKLKTHSGFHDLFLNYFIYMLNLEIGKEDFHVDSQYNEDISTSSSSN
jgi:hypothetical protein